MFEQFIGNEKVKKNLEEIIKHNNIVNSYIFTGKNGIGKKRFAKEFLKNILCNDEEDRKKFDNDAFMDYYEIKAEENSIKINEIREMQRSILTKPINSNKKAYIIDNAEMMTEESQNCLLKTLEEAPSYAIIILITQNENLLLSTIISRCVNIKFEKISNEEIKQKFNIREEEILELLDGSLENIEYIDKMQEEYKAIVQIINNIKNGKMIDVLMNSQILYTEKNDIIRLLEFMNILSYKKGLIEIIEIIEKVKRKILRYNNYDMSIDMLLMQSWKKYHNERN